MKISLTAAQAGFIKGLLMVVVLAGVSFLSDSNNLTALFSPAIATLVAALFSSLESYMKAQSGNTTALFGSVTLK